jgi:hypothetical protein
MATGSGTGTPAAGRSDATLNSLRDRIRTQIENASGFTEELVVTASSIQISSGSPNLRGLVQSKLQDVATKWSTTDIDDAVRSALALYSERNPVHALGTIALSADGREISLASLTGIIRVERVWWDYDSTTPGYPPNYRQFEVWPGSILYVDDRTEPSNGDTVRVWYTKLHTVNGLDSASATTIYAEDVEYIAMGAAHFAARARAMELLETANVDAKVVDRLEDWAEEEGRAFRYWIRQRPPAWQRYQSAYDQGDIDEALRWALHRLTEVLPDRVITSLTLSSAGREVDISSISDYIEIERVWWDYDSSDPAHPPNWRDFELWPGDILFINDAGEPESADVVRVWYTRLQSLNGLDSASTTSIPRDTETLITGGAAGYVVQERVQEAEGRFIPTKLREWAGARMREFERGLRVLGRREAARHSGIAEGASLDRWDSEASGWW